MATRPTGKVDHVILCVEPSNAQAAVAALENLLEITFEGPYDLQDGLLVWVDWDSGMEIFTPVDPEKAVAQRTFLDTHGEGIYRICFNVRDRDATLARAQEMGYPAAAKYDIRDLHPDWDARFSVGKESHIAPIFGLSLNICEIQEKP
jgi:hypothetical protein